MNCYFRMGRDHALILAPAKINLYLEVLGRRRDGYHELESLMMPIDLFDTIELEKFASPGLDLHVLGSDIPCGPENLAFRAAELFFKKLNEKAGVRIRLTKRIPHEAGLGGGSSNAACTLLAMNNLWNSPLSFEMLHEMAAELGSDVPFFLAGSAAWCRGRGELVEPLSNAPTLHFLIVKPPQGLSTRQVFSELELDFSLGRSDEMNQALQRHSPTLLGKNFFNRLQAVALGLQPELQTIYESMNRLESLGVVMSGSGTSFAALAQNAVDAQILARKLRPLSGVKLYSVRTITPSFIRDAS